MDVIIFVYFCTLLLVFRPIKAEDPSTNGGHTVNVEENIRHLLRPSRYNGPCDMDLHTTHVSPIYKATTMEEQNEARDRLNEHLGSNPDLQQKSCFGYVFDSVHSETLEPIYMSCQICQDNSQDNSTKHHCCRCLNEEPLVFEHKIGGGNPCKIKTPVLGDPCDFEKMQSYANEIYLPFQKSLQKAQSRKDYVTAIDKMALATDKYLMFMRNRRLVCHSEWKNLECKHDNRCGCRNQAPFFKYSEDGGRRCVGQNGSICHIQHVISHAGIFEKFAKCRDSKCVEARADLNCDPLAQRDCKFYSNLKTHDNSKLAILAWNIRTCAGQWPTQASQSSNIGISLSMNFIFAGFTARINKLGLSQ